MNMSKWFSKYYFPISFYYFLLGMMTLAVGCKKFVQIDAPTTQIGAVSVYSNNITAAAVMSGMYSNMIGSSSGLMTSGSGSIGYLQGLAADELTNYAGNLPYAAFYQNALTSSTGSSSNYYYWKEIYNEIHVANAVIEGLEGSTGVTPAIKQQLTGEAKFMRAFFHFYAVNFYGDVPLVTTTNYLVNNIISRSPRAEVYQQIIQDLKDAQTDLSSSFVDQSGNLTQERTRPNKGAATALLARAYLYTGKWDSATIEATLMINNPQYSLNDSLNTVFLVNSTEAIWQLSPVQPDYDTYDAIMYILTSTPRSSGNGSMTLSPSLLNAFEPGDRRRTEWVGSYTKDHVNYYCYPFKYQEVDKGNANLPINEYFMMFRLAEQYLIRAEAEAMTGDSTNAIMDLNMIRNRAGLAGYSEIINGGLLQAILHERQVELFTEWGHRWFDLIRTNNINSVMNAPGNISQYKHANWNSNDTLLPLPLLELQLNQNLTQNPGYN